MRGVLRLTAGAVLSLGIAFQLGCAHTPSRSETRALLHMKIGAANLAKGNYPLAMAEMSRALELDPDSPQIHNNIALVYDVRGRHKEAEEHFRKAIDLDSRYTEARVNLARLLIDQKRYKEARKQLTIANNDLTYPSPDRTLSLLGMLSFKEGDYKSASDFLKRSMMANRHSCVTANFYGRTLYQEKKYKDAAEVLDQAIEDCRSAGFEDPLFYSALAYYQTGNMDKARSRVEELIKNHPQSHLMPKARGLMALLQ